MKLDTPPNYTQQGQPVDGRPASGVVYRQRPDALELVIETLAALQDGSALPNHCRLWLRDGLFTFMTSGGGMKMDEALEVKPGNGQSPLPKRYRFIARNYHLRRAATYCAGETQWARSMELSAAVKRFASGVWARTKHSPAPPTSLSPIQWELFMAFCAGDIPTSARQLDNIVGAKTKPPVFISGTQEHAAYATEPEEKHHEV